MKTVSAKREWPDWTPPAEMLRRRPDLPRHMAGGSVTSSFIIRMQPDETDWPIVWGSLVPWMR
jgi:lipoprotein-anchoring transpeptidase ErfK/SrfK